MMSRGDFDARLDQLFDAAGRVLDVADKHQQQVELSIAQTQQLILQLRKVFDGLPDLVRTTVAQSMVHATNVAAKGLTTRLGEAEQAACLAGERYERATRIFPLSIALAVLGGLAIATLGLLLLAYMFVPTTDEILRLVATRDQLAQ